MARLVALQADLPLSVGGATVNRFCGSSMHAIHIAAGQIQLGAGEAFICAGVESMTRIPMGGYNPMPNATLNAKQPGAYMGMGDTAENVSRRWQITRAAQEELAVRSHQRAAAAQADGKLVDEIVPIQTNGHAVDKDGCIRADTTTEALAGLKPAFNAEGTVTAGTSSPLTDGAAAVLLCSEEFAKRHNLEPLARLASVAVSGCEPDIMGIGPVAASRKALKRANIDIGQIDVVELNEAFAAQALACMKELGIRDETLNLDGGAIALGHPLGATGARITGKAASLLEAHRRPLRARHAVHRRRAGHRHHPGAHLMAETSTNQKSPIRKVAVIGSGVMGAGIAAQIANAGVPVLLLDIVGKDETDRSSVARGAVAKLLKTEPAPLMSERAAKLIGVGNIDDDLAKIADCDWIVEVGHRAARPEAGALQEDRRGAQARHAGVVQHLDHPAGDAGRRHGTPSPRIS